MSMQPRAQVCLSARCLFGGHAVPAPAGSVFAPVSISALDQSVDRQLAYLERVLSVLATTATATVLFAAVVSCIIALCALYGCVRARRRRRGSSAPVPLVAAREEITKRALAGISVQVVALQARDGGGGVGRKQGGGGGAEVPVVVEEEEETGCAVCLAEYAAGDEVRVLPACRHGFHMACVDRWLLTRAPTCPVCRAPLRPDAMCPYVRGLDCSQAIQ